MAASDYLLTPRDAVNGFSSVSTRQYIGTFLAVAVFFAMSWRFSFDFAFLVAGILAMLLGRIDWRAPFYVALVGLFALMVTSPLVEDDNQWERFANNIAVGVFFMLLFGVYKMLQDQVMDSWNARGLSEDEFIEPPIKANMPVSGAGTNTQPRPIPGQVPPMIATSRTAPSRPRPVVGYQQQTIYSKPMPKKFARPAVVTDLSSAQPIPRKSKASARITPTVPAHKPISKSPSNSPKTIAVPASNYLDLSARPAGKRPKSKKTKPRMIGGM